MPDYGEQGRRALKQERAARSKRLDRYPSFGIASTAPTSYGSMVAFSADRIALKFAAGTRTASPGEILVVYGDEGYKACVYLAEVDPPYALGQVVFRGPDRPFELTDLFSASPSADW